MEHSEHLTTGAKNFSIVFLVVFVFVLPSIVSPVTASALVKINSDNLSFGGTVSQSQIDSILAASSPESLVSAISHISGSMIGTHSFGANAFSELKSTLNSLNLQPSIAGQTAGSAILVHVPLTVNVIFAGVPTQVADQNLFRSLLPSSYTQVDEAHDKNMPLVQYDVSYNFVTAPPSFTSGYVSYLLSSSTKVLAPSWIQNTYGNRTAAMADAFNAENYIWTNLASQYSGFSVVLVNPSSFPANHFYNGTVPDPDTGVITDSEGAKYMVAFGGAHRMMFVDFDAGPEHYTTEQSGGHLPRLLPLWTLDLTTTTGLATAQAEMINSVRFALEGRFANSFLYTPLYHAAILFNATIYSMDTTVTWSKYLNTQLLQTAFSELDPSATILQPQVREISGQSDPAFYNVLQSSRYTLQVGGSTLNLYNNTLLKDYFAHHLSKYASTSLVLSDGTPVYVIPVIVVAGLDNIDDLFKGIVGSANPGPDGNFGYVETIISPIFLTIGLGLTHTVIHEAGHALGLSHPHDIYDYKSAFVTYWLEDFSSTPMSYCCEYTHYDALAKDNLEQGLAVTLVNESLTLATLGEQVYKTLGYGELPPQALTEENTAISDLTNAKSLFSAVNPDYATAASDALDAVHHIETGIKILFQDLMSITYVVTDGQGQPLPNASVQVVLPNGTKIVGFTGGEGKLSLTGLPWGNYTYTVRFQGIIVGNAALKEEGSTSRTLQAGVSKLSFLVTDDKGAPLANARIIVLAPNGTSVSVVTNVSGVASLGLSADGSYQVTKVSWQGVEVTPSQQVSTELTGTATSTVKARVYNLSLKVSDILGIPISGVKVTLNHPNGTQLTATTNGDGVAIFADLPYGEYSGSVSYLGQTASLQLSGTSVSGGSSIARLGFGPASLGIFTIIPGAAIGLGVFAVRRRYKHGAQPGVTLQPAYVPSPAPQTPPQYQYPMGQYPPGQYPPTQYPQYPPSQAPPQVPQPAPQTTQTQYPASQTPAQQQFRPPSPQPLPSQQPATPFPSAQVPVQPAQPQLPTAQAGQVPQPLAAQTQPSQLPPASVPQVPPSVPQYAAQAQQTQQVQSTSGPQPGVPTAQPAIIPTPVKMQFCPSCGTKLFEGSKFCHACGRQF